MEPKEIRDAIRTLNATQTRMAIILLRVNGKESALKFISQIAGNKPKTIEEDFFKD